MNRHDAFIVADWLVQLSTVTYAKGISSEEYVKRRSLLIKELTEHSSDSGMSS